MTSRQVRTIARKARVRLCARYRRLIANGKKRAVATTAIAREIATFLWAIGHQVEPQAPTAGPPTDVAKAHHGSADYCSGRVFVVKPPRRQRRRDPENLIIDLPQQVQVNFVSLKGFTVLTKTDRLQPFSDLAHGFSRSSSDLAFFKSSVSKPSVNQP
jgi:hypothetical protein